jgi:hypothetical protein
MAKINITRTDLMWPGKYSWWYDHDHGCATECAR